MAVDLTPAAYFTRAGVSGTDQTQGGWFVLDAVPAVFNSLFALDSGAPNWMGIYVDNDGGSGRLNFWENSGAALITGPVLTLGERYYVSVRRTGSTWDMFWRHEDDAALTHAGSATVQGTVGTSLSIGKESVVDAATSFNGQMGYWRIHTSSLSEAEILAESESTVPVVAAWGSWVCDPLGIDTSGNGRHLTASGTMVDAAPPALDGPPVPAILAASAVTTDATVYSTPSVAPHAGSLVVLDVLGRDSVAVAAPAISGGCITGLALDVVLANSWAGVQSFRYGRYTAEGTGTPDAIDLDWTGAGSPPLTGAGFVVAAYPAGTELRQTTTAEGSGTALTAGTLDAFGPDGAGLVGWATALNSAATPEAGWVEVFDAGYNSPTTRLIQNWRSSEDTTPTATTGATAGWAGIASELGPPGGTPVEGTLAGVLPALTGQADGTAVASGDLAGVLPALTGGIDGNAASSGDMAGTLPAITGSLSGNAVTDTGVLAGALPALVGSMTGEASSSGQIAGSLPALAAQFAGAASAAGVMAGTLPALTGALSGGTPVAPGADVSVEVGALEARHDVGDLAARSTVARLEARYSVDPMGLER